jgi:hypothetical protein
VRAQVNLAVGPHDQATLGYNTVMSVTEIKSEILQLPPSEMANLAEWFEEIYHDAWDRQIAEDMKAGRFDALLQRVEEQAASGQCTLL